MIEKIEVKKVGSCFDDCGIVLFDLKPVNFIYGTNGSGKTTISKLISKPNNYSNCKVEWENNSNMKTLVYNVNFVDDNFHQDTIKGIFTLGKESYEIQDKINAKKTEVDKINGDIINLKSLLEEKNNEKAQNELVYELNCWKLKQKYDNDFQNAFSGYRNSKKQFKEKCKEEAQNNSEALNSYDELKARADTIFGLAKEKISVITNINYCNLEKVEANPILYAKIVGNQDVDISELIRNLNISDWVKQGYEYFKLTDSICPFCQQKTSNKLNEQFKEYFNENYNQKLEQVKMFVQEYIVIIESLLKNIDSILTNSNQFFEINKIEQQKNLIITKYQINKVRLEGKVKELSNCIELESLIKDIEDINQIIDLGNKKILEHNDLVDNFEKKKSILISRIWRFIIEENSLHYQNYFNNNTKFEKAIIGIIAGLKSKEIIKKKLEQEIKELETQIISIIPTITEINRILESFGFFSFKLIEAENRGYYKIIRENGEDAKDTLSEGEKTFITFLYFYYLIRGSNDSESITANKIVVFDDPISSLDSNVLFIVSNLIKGIIDDIRNQNGYVKQIFIFTHNIYFHKEVTFSKKRSGNKRLCDETFWILRKRSLITQIEYYGYNPIKTSYELLWQELKSYTEKNTITVQNTMRRIIENYFKILGHLGDDDLINKFDSDEKIICKSLMSWINDGSHFVNDDLYVESSSELVEKYLQVFKKIFALTGNMGHYEMMWGK